MADEYPDLARPLNLSTGRYNQHTTYASLIVEIGTSANELDEAIISAELFGDVLAKEIERLRRD